MRNLFLYLALLTTVSVVGFFSLINYVTLKAELEMSMLAQTDKDTLVAWSAHAENLYEQQDLQALNSWLDELQETETEWAAIVSHTANVLAGEPLPNTYTGYSLGRSIDWKIHLYFPNNPTMELPFKRHQASFLIKLPQRMRPGSFWAQTKFLLQFVLPLLFLVGLSWIIYRHIMQPLHALKFATESFSKGDYSARIGDDLKNKGREFSELASTFDNMAKRIGAQIVAQRQLIGDFSHELRTPLARLDLAIENAENRSAAQQIARIDKESSIIRRLVEDTLSYAWLENEQIRHGDESFDVVDLIDAIVDDARFEYPQHLIECDLPESLLLHYCNHKALGPAIENVLRNSLKYSPEQSLVKIRLQASSSKVSITIVDQGPGVPEHNLDKIFLPFYRVDASRQKTNDSFGLGLALAKRQIASLGGEIQAHNVTPTGLKIKMSFPSRPA